MDAAFDDAGIGAGGFAQINKYSSNNRSFYDGVNIQLRKRMSKRYAFQASYVISVRHVHDCFSRGVPAAEAESP